MSISFVVSGKRGISEIGSRCQRQRHFTGSQRRLCFKWYFSCMPICKIQTRTMTLFQICLKIQAFWSYTLFFLHEVTYSVIWNKYLPYITTIYKISQYAATETKPRSLWYCRWRFCNLIYSYFFFLFLLCYNNKCFCIDWYSSYRLCYCIFFYSTATERGGCAIHWFSFESSLHIFYQSHSIKFNNFWNNHHLKFWYTLSWKQLFFLFIFL